MRRPVQNHQPIDATEPLKYGWSLLDCPAGLEGIAREWVCPAACAVPPSIARQLKQCRISLAPRLNDGELSSRWTETDAGVSIEVACEGVEGHDAAMEFLVCVGQALWETLDAGLRRGYLKLLGVELEAGVAGEIDEDALREKRALLSSRRLAASPRRLDHYAGVSFASTAAEYIHCLWHDVTVRSGPEHLPAPWLRRRLEWMARRFPPGPGQRLLPNRGKRPYSGSSKAR